MFAAVVRGWRAQGGRSNHWSWHLDKVVRKTSIDRHYHWRAFHHEGEVFNGFLTKHRNQEKAALKTLFKTLSRCIR